MLLFYLFFCGATSAAILSDPDRLDRLMRSRTRENTVDRRDVIDPPMAPYRGPGLQVRPYTNESADSSTAAAWSAAVPNVWADYYSVPWEMLNPADLASLGGLSEFVSAGRYFDVKSLGPSFALTLPIDEKGLFIPGNTSLLFMFNTSRSISFKSDSSSPFADAGAAHFADANAARIIQTSLPFGLPRYHYVENYSLLVPKHLLSQSAVETVPVEPGDAWVRRIGLRRIAIPLSKEMVQTSGPVLAFVFRSGESLRDFVEESDVARLLAQEERLEKEVEARGDGDVGKHGLRGVTPAVLHKYRTKKKTDGGVVQAVDGNSTLSNSTISQTPTHEDLGRARGHYAHAKTHINDALVKSSSDVAKAVLASSSTFFDNFARRWAATVGVQSLLQSTFCQVNCKFHEQSYCLKFEEEGHAVVSLLSVSSDALNSAQQQQPGLQKRGLRPAEKVKYALEDRVFALGQIMLGVRDYANKIGIKNEARYYNLRYMISSRLAPLRLKVHQVEQGPEVSTADDPSLEEAEVQAETEQADYREPNYDDNLWAGWDEGVDRSAYNEEAERSLDAQRAQYGRVDGSDGYGIRDGFDAYKAERDPKYAQENGLDLEENGEVEGKGEEVEERLEKRAYTKYKNKKESRLGRPREDEEGILDGLDLVGKFGGAVSQGSKISARGIEKHFVDGDETDFKKRSEGPSEEMGVSSIWVGRPHLKMIRIDAPEINTDVFFGRLQRFMNRHDQEYQDEFEDEEDENQCEDDYDEYEEEYEDEDWEEEEDCEDEEEEEEDQEWRQETDSEESDDCEDEEDAESKSEDCEAPPDPYYSSGQFDDLVEGQKIEGEVAQAPPVQVGTWRRRYKARPRLSTSGSSRRQALKKRALRAYSKVDALKSLIDEKLTTQTDCVPITWKLVFEHALYGVPERFCTREQTLAQLRSDYKDEGVRSGEVPADRPYAQLKAHLRSKFGGKIKRQES